MAPLGNNRNGTFSESELRAVEHSVFGGRRVLWAGVLAVLLPLAILLGLQYLWLADLEKNSAIAREATLKNYLEAITKEVHYFYWKISERALNLPPEIFGEKKTEKAAGYFKKKEIDGAKRLFVVSFLSREGLLFYDSKHKKMMVPKHSDETVAVWAAASPWSYLRKKGTKIKTTALSTDLRDPNNRIILNPITDEHDKLVGLAGMIVDQNFFLDELLPKAIELSLPKFEEEEKGELVVIVRDNRKHQILPSGKETNPKKDLARRPFALVFTDWNISLQGDFASPEKWARANFAYNMTLSAVLAAVLLGGIALTIRTALREMKLSAMKNEFVSNVSHELRTPLSSIRVFGEFMRRGRVESQDKVREYGSYIETESRRLTQLINNILDFSRIESGRKVYTFEDADLEEILAGTLATFTELTARWPISWTTRSNTRMATGRSRSRSTATTATPSSRSPITASVSPATNRRKSSRDSIASVPAWCMTSRVRGSDCPSYGISPSRTAAPYRSRAKSVAAAPSPSTCR
jgi:hypothetical protein